MLDTQKIQLALDNLKSTIDTADKSNTISEIASRKKNTLEAVNGLLTALLNKDAREFAMAQAKSNKDSLKRNRPLPTYNVRTPVVYISINGIPVFPFRSSKDRDESKYTGIYFQGFEASFPLGGAETTVVGSLSLFAKDPSLVINAIESKSKDFRSISGLPVATIQWGWNFAIDGTEGVKQTLSPPIDFLITSIDMTNPDTGGTNFIFKLHDIGNIILNYSRRNIIVASDYPQEQIRVIVEGMLGLRLFTLDDLLNMAGRLKGSASDWSDYKTFFVNDKLGPVKTNGNNYLTICDQLAYSCRCRWYSVPNSDLKKSISSSQDANNKVSGLVDKLSQLKKTNDIKSIDDTSTELSNAFDNMSLTCRLYWVNNVPKEWKTTSGTNYIDEFNEEGAYFLLPDLAHIDGNDEVDLCYGPGASAFPYLHGSAQNVFNASISDSSNTFGDVLNLSVKYDNMVALLKASMHESSANLVDSAHAATVGGTKFDLESEVSKLAGGASTKTTVNATELAKESKAKFDTELNSARSSVRKYNRFSNVFGRTNVDIGDDSTRLNPIDKQFYNVSSIDEHSSLLLRNRLNFFLKFPQSITMTVFGDPNLIRLGAGGFELISYYPTDDGNTQVLNSLVSGIYKPIKITHKIGPGDYTCELSGVKQNTILNSGSLVAEIVNTTSNSTDKPNSKIPESSSSQYANVDLTSSNFTSGFLSKALKDLYNSTKTSN